MKQENNPIPQSLQYTCLVYYNSKFIVICLQY